jgi:hypothetical protein
MTNNIVLDTVIYISSVIIAIGVIYTAIIKPLRTSISGIMTKAEFDAGVSSVTDRIDTLDHDIAEIKHMVADLSNVQNEQLRERLTWLLRKYIDDGCVPDDDLYDAAEKMYNVYVETRGLNGRVEKLWEKVQELPFGIVN